MLLGGKEEIDALNREDSEEKGGDRFAGWRGFGEACHPSFWRLS
jgi:hypothetical protein